jgi:hypothetical protein
MNLKTAIGITRWATLIASITGLAAFLFYFFIWKNSGFILVALPLLLMAAIITLSKKYWIKHIFRKVKYPGLLYGICDKMGFFRNLDLDPGEEVMDDLYKPAYDTEEFLWDNKLNPEVFPSRSSSVYLSILLIYLLPMALFYAGIYFPELKSRYFYLLAVPALIAGIVIGDKLTKKHDADAWPDYIFSAKGLSNKGIMLEWGNLYDWEYVAPKKKGDQGFMEVSMKLPVNEERVFRLDISGETASVIDFCTLMMHYQYKYGYKPDQS